MPRLQLLDVNDVVPTIYDLIGIKPARVVNGIEQDPFDGVTFASTFNNAKAPEVKHIQYFEVMGSRSIYHDGWIASAVGPRIPWVPGLPPGIKEWTPDQKVGTLQPQR
jgi:arylsulfatase